MTRKRRGFWLFMFSLIPGAGEMYLGFFKQGISVMTIFFALIAGSAWLNIGALLFVMPVLWFYSFFHVHNLASLSDEEFFSIQDDYLFLSGSSEIRDMFSGAKGRKITAVVLIIVGISALWDIFCSFIYQILEWCGIQIDSLYSVLNRVPQFAFAVLIIWFGVYLIKGKKEKLDTDSVIAIEDKQNGGQ